MSENRETFLEKQINVYADLIDELERTGKTLKQKINLLKYKKYYQRYTKEYIHLLFHKIESKN